MNPAIANWLFLWEHYMNPELYLICTEGRDTQLAFKDNLGEVHAIPKSAVRYNAGLTQKLGIKWQSLKIETQAPEDLGIPWVFEDGLGLYSVPVTIGTHKHWLEIRAVDSLDARRIAQEWAKIDIGDPIAINGTMDSGLGLVKADMPPYREHT
ncbi:MAG: hypothetical protein EBU84_16715 [Actinobacteria bacterium]|nr:hypothetical protein [Actinomycetota bacterium]